MSQGSQVSSLAEMKVGDFISCRYTATSGVAGSFSELGSCVENEIPVSGSATPDGKFNFIKVDKGLCIADRVVQTGVSWDVLNSSKLIEGKTGVIASIPTAIIRSLTGGNSYLDANGNSSTTNASLGAYPPNNEWDSYIVKSDLEGKIIAGDNNVWHWFSMRSLCQDTPILAIYVSSLRVMRAFSSVIDFSGITSSSSNTFYGFRPVLTYIE